MEGKIPEMPPKATESIVCGVYRESVMYTYSRKNIAKMLPNFLAISRKPVFWEIAVGYQKRGFKRCLRGAV
jgi:hypothetical protein